MLRPAQHITIIWILLFALAAGILGVILDHHYADRQPWHDHIFLNQTLGDHSHQLVSDHHHAEGPVEATSNLVTSTANFTSSAYWALLSLGIALFTYLVLIGPPPLEVRRGLTKYRPLKTI